MDKMDSLAEFLKGSSWIMPGLFAVAVLTAYWLYRTVVEDGWGWERRIGRMVGVSPSVWSDLTKVQKTVVKDVWAKCNGYGVRFRLGEGTKVSYPGGSIMVSGYFNGDSKLEAELCVAVGKESDSWVQVLLHESSHMDQWAENSDLWSRCMMDGRDVYDLMDEWVSGRREMTDGETEEVFRRCMELEYDCERRTVEKLKGYGMDEGIDEYIQKSNSYVWAYYVMRVKRRWYSNPPYEVKAVWERMPKRFMDFGDYFRMDWETMTYFTRFCFLNRDETREGVEL